MESEYRTLNCSLIKMLIDSPCGWKWQISLTLSLKKIANPTDAKCSFTYEVEYIKFLLTICISSFLGCQLMLFAHIFIGILYFPFDLCAIFHVMKFFQLLISLLIFKWCFALFLLCKVITLMVFGKLLRFYAYILPTMARWHCCL